ELVIDPTCSIVFEAEPEEADVMDRPPRPASERLLGGGLVPTALLQGLLALALVSAVLGFAVGSGHDDTRTRTLTFPSPLLVNLVLIFTNRSRSRSALSMLGVPNRALAWVVAGALAVLLLSFLVPSMRVVLRFGPPSGLDVAAALLTGGVALVGFEA